MAIPHSNLNSNHCTIGLISLEEYHGPLLEEPPPKSFSLEGGLKDFLVACWLATLVMYVLAITYLYCVQWLRQDYFLKEGGRKRPQIDCSKLMLLENSNEIE